MIVWKKTFDKLKKAYDDLDKMLTEAINNEHKFKDIIEVLEERERLHQIEMHEMIKELVLIKNENVMLKKMIKPEVDTWSKD